jgi:ferredoxin
MQSGEPHFHYVATRAEAQELIAAAERFWISNCGCREGGSGCERSRTDVCLFFDPQMGGTGSDFREVDRAFAGDLLREAEEKRLVVRPFRYDEDRTRTQGVCFCCDDCCYYLQGEKEQAECDKGKYIGYTDREACAACGTCVEACYFGAREIADSKLAVAEAKCYGCGLCLDVCPEECISLVGRG